MSQANVDARRAAIEAFDRRDGDGFDAYLPENAEIVPVRRFWRERSIGAVIRPRSTAPP